MSPDIAPVQRAVQGLQAVQAKVDPLGWLPATVKVAARAASRPGAVVAATARLALGAAQTPVATAGRALRLPVSPAVEPSENDPRFRDPAWEQNPYYFAVRQCHALANRYLNDLLEAGAVGGVTDRKASMALHLALDALAPSNFPATNPEVAIEAFRTGGRSVVDGARLAWRDLREHKGLPEKVDRSAFEVGVDLACSSGQVVYRNDLIELIQYAPSTDQVHAVPLLGSPPWINKFYVMDLASERSLVEWAVQHQRTVFMISYRNPDESMRAMAMGDYFEQGLLSALDVVTDITGSETVDLLALCLGGAMAAMSAAHLAATDDPRVGTLTLLNTMLDYADPGDLATFVDPGSLARLDLRMRETGFLQADDMALAFDLLRARDLIFRYIPSRWLMGQEARPFDILAWNADTTRMPATMHSNYLRLLYGKNLLAKGELVLAGQRLDLGAVTAPTYVVGAINDHIVPWTSSYAATRLLGGPVRYVLSSGGHIAGVVNPPSPKSWFQADPPSTPGSGSTSYPDDPQQWLSVTERTAGSWWEDWLPWASQYAGPLGPLPPLGSESHPPLEPAPGSYVRG